MKEVNYIALTNFLLELKKEDFGKSEIIMKGCSILEIEYFKMDKKGR